uniref:Phosphatidylethanolamine-binding protein n=1 Tax=viral metagenome TaxID=1070528 RepID=A0A6C0D9P4_9ZZZZ
MKTRKNKKKGGNANITITYNTTIQNNSYKTKGSTSMIPYIKLLSLPLSTLVMYDPDAMQPQYIHYLVTNIQNGDISNGTTIFDYNGPTPPVGTGIHRYIFEQLIQKQPIDVSIDSRAQFDISAFKQKYNLQMRASKKFKVRS